MQKSKLISDNPELLIYLEGSLHITILGGIKLTGLDRLKVTLKLTTTSNKHQAFHNHLYLYNSIQVEKLTEKAGEALDLSTGELNGVINRLITALEDYRNSRLEAMKLKKEEKRELTDTERKAALKYLSTANLMECTISDIEKSGLIGETVNRMIAYLAYTSRKRHTPLHLL